MKIKIKVTKDVLKKSMWCGVERKQRAPITESCAIALAVRDIFPNARVSQDAIQINFFAIELPCEAKLFIAKFDALKITYPQDRLKLPEISFEIEVPEKLIAEINIDDIHKSATLELI